jgi:hypothetical protein
VSLRLTGFRTLALAASTYGNQPLISVQAFTHSE